MPASNTIDCITSFVGEELKGVLVGSRSTYTLIFASGRGLTLAANPAGYMVWWEERPADLRRALDRKAGDLRATGAKLADVLELAGVVGRIDASSEAEGQ